MDPRNSEVKINKPQFEEEKPQLGDALIDLAGVMIAHVDNPINLKNLIKALKEISQEYEDGKQSILTGYGYFRGRSEDVATCLTELEKIFVTLYVPASNGEKNKEAEREIAAVVADLFKKGDWYETSINTLFMKKIIQQLKGFDLKHPLTVPDQVSRVGTLFIKQTPPYLFAKKDRVKREAERVMLKAKMAAEKERKKEEAVKSGMDAVRETRKVGKIADNNLLRLAAKRVQLNLLNRGKKTRATITVGKIDFENNVAMRNIKEQLLALHGQSKDEVVLPVHNMSEVSMTSQPRATPTIAPQRFIQESCAPPPPPLPRSLTKQTSGNFLEATKALNSLFSGRMKQDGEVKEQTEKAKKEDGVDRMRR